MLKLLGLVNMSAASGQNSTADNRGGDGICNLKGDGIYARAHTHTHVTDSRLEHATHGWHARMPHGSTHTADVANVCHACDAWWSGAPCAGEPTEFPLHPRAFAL